MHGLHKTGREFPIEMSLSSWISDGRRFHCGIVRDITDREAAEAQLRQQQIEQQVLLDLIPAMVWYKDSHNRILRANRRAAESIDKSVAEIEGRSTYDLYPEEAEKYHRDDMEVIVSGQPKLGIVELYAGSHEKRWVQTDKVPYRDAEGNMGVLVFAQDITERKRTEEALRKRAAAAHHGGIRAEWNGDGECRRDDSAGERATGRAIRLRPARAHRAVGGSARSRPVPSSHPGHRSAFLSDPGLRAIGRRDFIGLRKDGTEFQSRSSSPRWRPRTASMWSHRSATSPHASEGRPQLKAKKN